MKNINFAYKIKDVRCKTQTWEDINDSFHYAMADIPFAKRVLVLEFGKHYFEEKEKDDRVCELKCCIYFSVKQAKQYGIPFDGTPESVKRISQAFEGKVFNGEINLENIIFAASKK